MKQILTLRTLPLDLDDEGNTKVLATNVVINVQRVINLTHGGKSLLVAYQVSDRIQLVVSCFLFKFRCGHASLFF